MLPLSNIRMLAPLIVGFALEQVDIDSLATRFEELVLESHRKGMSEEEITIELFNVMQNQGTQIYTLTSVPVYSEPKDADKYVSIWCNASDTPAGRDKHKQDNVSWLVDRRVSQLTPILDSKNTEGSNRIYRTL
jgi:hypothetical protein